MFLYLAVLDAISLDDAHIADALFQCLMPRRSTIAPMRFCRCDPLTATGEIGCFHRAFHELIECY